MAGTEKERDWDKEMAEVDRLLKKLPEADPTLGRGSGGSGSAPTVKKPVVVPGAMPTALGTWAKVALGVLVGIGIAPGVWPRRRAVGQRVVVEAAPRRRARGRAGAHHLGGRARDPRSAPAHRDRQRGHPVAVSGRATSLMTDDR